MLQYIQKHATDHEYSARSAGSIQTSATPKSSILDLKSNLRTANIDKTFTVKNVPSLMALLYPWLCLILLLQAKLPHTRRAAKHLLFSFLAAVGLLWNDVDSGKYTIRTLVVDYATFPRCLYPLTIGFYIKSMLKMVQCGLRLAVWLMD